MMEFINWYRDEYSKINGNDWNFQINNSSENLLRESKVFCLHAYMIDIIFCMWMASRHLNDSIDVATDFMVKLIFISIIIPIINSFLLFNRLKVIVGLVVI